MNPEDLISFEKGIADCFNRGEIKFPIHLSGGNEQQLLDVFNKGHWPFKKGDWCFSNWRSHYHALLAGIPPEEVKRQIMAGRSMTICSPEHNFFASAIVAGCCSIALGVAWQLKRTKSKNRAWLFIGDMTAMGGTAYECAQYARWHDLPLYVVVENNGKSVCTDTAKTWGCSYKNSPAEYLVANQDYSYDLSAHWPHAGSGKRIQF